MYSNMGFDKCIDSCMPHPRTTQNGSFTPLLDTYQGFVLPAPGLSFVFIFFIFLVVASEE